jgi:hypothetical protein
MTKLKISKVLVKGKDKKKVIIYTLNEKGDGLSGIYERVNNDGRFTFEGDTYKIKSYKKDSNYEYGWKVSFSKL